MSGDQYTEGILNGLRNIFLEALSLIKGDNRDEIPKLVNEWNDEIEFLNKNYHDRRAE